MPAVVVVESAPRIDSVEIEMKTNRLAVIKFSSLLFLLLIGLLVEKVQAVDDDPFAYTVPYFVVDPETGQLVEVDPAKEAANTTSTGGVVEENYQTSAVTENSTPMKIAIAVGFILGVSFLLAYIWLKKSKSNTVSL